MIAVAAFASQRSAAQINVAADTEGVTSGSCSVQEAIYATEFRANVALDQTDPDHTYSTGCSDPSGAWNEIDLPGGTLTFTKSWDGDAHNPFGPTATPIIFTTITIVGHGTTLQWTGPENYRLFAIGAASITFGPLGGVLTSGTYSGTGNLTLQDVYVKGFQAKGGDGGYGIYDSASGGSGGGLGAGGAIYVGQIPGIGGVPILTVQNSTFAYNGAIGGNGTEGGYGSGGGGMGGNGGIFGGGGGSRGNGGKPCGDGGDCFDSGGGGGGTVFDGSGDGPGGYLCGGSGGSSSNHDGHGGTCPGGGGGGSYFFGDDGNGGDGAFGGGGGGAAAGNGNGGHGGFGGGGGAGNAEGGGGGGGFGGGGGDSYGPGGPFGGNASFDAGGGGGALGGAIFNDSGTVVVQNSTFYDNSVTRGLGGAQGQTYVADNGGDSGGAIFSRDGSLTVQNVTISGNQATGAGGGIVVYKDSNPTIFILDNTIIANNGAQECIADAGVLTNNGPAKSANNLIVKNSGCPAVTVPSDPKLDSLPKLNSPGDTPTMALLPGSPATDAGDDTTALGTDQRGVLRPQGAHSDIGAFERIPQADLSLSKTVGSSTAKAGDTVTYTLTLSNLGPDTANSITVTDNFPSALTFVSCSAPGGTCGSLGASVAVTYTSLAANSSATITIKGTLNSGYARGTIIENDASVQDTSPADPDNTNNSASASFKVIVPDFSVEAVSPITVPIGGSGTSSVTITSIDTFSSAVALTSSGPAGLDNSFSQSSVTPPSNSSASSTLTISLEPSVAPGTYNVTVTGTSGALIHSATVTANVQATIGGTITVINTDQALGCIDNSGISGALRSKLNAALAAIAAGNNQVAINTLQALLNQLQAQAGKHISTSCKDGSGNAFNPDAVLIADVKAILASLGVNAAADPIMGTVMNTSGAGISGVTVNLLNSSKSVISSAMTDAMGFFYFPATGGLAAGATYTNKVATVKPYKNSTPPTQSFTWRATAVLLKNFVIN